MFHDCSDLTERKLMAATALALCLFYGISAFGWRAAVQRRRTDDSGFRGSPISALEQTWLQLAGVVLSGIGITGTLAAQVAMGDSWRVGVDPGEQTELVTDGPFALTRNPIFTMMLLTALGLTAIVPNALTLAGLVGLAVGVELQVRIVEEPYLATVQAGYNAYAARVGRFLPGVGRRR